MDYKTLTGIDVGDIPERLDEQLPKGAYAPVPGGAKLTDIDPNYMRIRLTEVFGLCGYGWGFDYEAPDLEYSEFVQKTQTGERHMFKVVLKKMRFWYKLLTDNGNQVVCSFNVTGGNSNNNDAYALKGAITNAIGHAASNLLFQISVYTGKRDHRSSKRPIKVDKPAGKSAEEEPEKLPRPYPPDIFAEKFTELVEFYRTKHTEDTIKLNDREIIASCINRMFSGTADEMTEKRHKVLEFLTGHASSKELDKYQVMALKHILDVKSFNEPPNAFAIKEFTNTYNHLVKGE